ncbi:tol-pal system protein YbgF [Zymobacter sp. IVIA_12111.31 C1]|uniref:tol-pal system protein YbgF n=1 Tax=Zymobacter sp. IVIA_12111.31 C1 TaxID=3394854 RepID=UPI0039C0C99E
MKTLWKGLCGVGALVLPLSVWADDVAAPVQDAGSAPAQAQNVSVQNTPAASGNMVLFNQLQSQQTTIDQLQGRLEELQHQLDDQQQRSLQRYDALEQRLSALENGNSAGANSDAAAPATSDAATDSAKGSAEAGGAQEAYQKAFDLVQAHQNDQAIAAFEAFSTQYANDPLCANAQYWLGELYLKGSKADKAEKAFLTVVNDYPKSSKRADALYKLGLVNARQGRVDDAQKRLQQVMKEYPKSSAAGLADTFLKKVAG